MTQPHGRNSPIVLLSLADVGFALLSLYLACRIRTDFLVRWPELWSPEVAIGPTYRVLLLISLPVIVTAMYIAGAYSWPRLTSVLRVAISIGKAAVLATLTVAASAYALRELVLSRAIVVSFLVLCFGFAFATRLVVRRKMARAARAGHGMQNAVIVGTGPGAMAIAESLRRKPYLGHRVVGFVRFPGERNEDPSIPTMCDVDELPEIVDESVVDIVIFAVSFDESAKCEKIIWRLEEVGKTVHLRGDTIGVMLSRTLVGEFDGLPMLTLRTTPGDPLALGLKRAIDLVVSTAALAMLSPLLLATAIAVRLGSPGPVFYLQDRVGLNGRIFKIIKFRSMYVDADRRLDGLKTQNEMSGPVFKMKNDPRTTPIGRWIRRFSIDELPQLWNVLRGDMSLVGPRPPIPSEVRQYERWQRRRLSMKSGITCLWQTTGRNDVDFDTWMKLDMEYIDNWSLGLDLKILLKTIPVVLTAKGAR